MGDIYGVYIIESLSDEDEDIDRSDGRVLCEMLRLMEIPCEYRYIRTKLELRAEIERFDNLRYKYLHFSCHGSTDGTEIRLSRENVSFEEFGSIVGPSMHRRRLFISACKIACFDLAKHLIPQYHCLSVIGTPDEPGFDEAAIFWSSFFYLVSKQDKEGMTQKLITPTLRRISLAFGLRLNYFSIIASTSKASIDHLVHRRIGPGGKYEYRRRLTPFTNRFRADELSK